MKGRSPPNQAHYQQLLHRQILPTFGKKPLGSITMEMVDRWYAKTALDTPTLRAHSYSLLRTILETARTRDRLIAVNPSR